MRAITIAVAQATRNAGWKTVPGMPDSPPVTEANCWLPPMIRTISANAIVTIAR